MLMNTIMDDDDVARFARRSTTRPRTASSAARAETRLRHHDGSWRWFEVTFTNLFDDPSVEGWVANLRDISERKQSEAALRQAQEVFRHAFDEAGIGMTLVDPSGRIIRANEAMQQMLGYETRRRARRRERDRHHAPRRPPDHRGPRRRRSSPATSDGFRMEKRLLRADGDTVWVALTVSTVRGRRRAARCSRSARSRTSRERKAFSDRLEYEAAHDAMTGPAEPRRASPSASRRRSRRTRRTAGNAAVLFIDLDHFKIINDSLGHAAGDDLLITVAQRLRHTLRPGDLLARFGGDEFVLLCTNIVGDRAVSDDRAAR